MNYLIFAAFLSIASYWFTFNLARKTGICSNFFEIDNSEARNLVLKTRERLYYLSLISWTGALLLYLMYFNEYTPSDTKLTNMLLAIFCITYLILILPYTTGKNIRKKDPYYKAI